MASTSTTSSSNWDESLNRSYKLSCKISVDLQICQGSSRERSSQQDKRIGKLKRVSYADWAVMHRLLIGSMDKVDGHDALQGGSQLKDLPFEKELNCSDDTHSV